MSFLHLKYQVDDFVAMVTLDRPPVNALNRELVAELAEVAGYIGTEVGEGRVRTVIISAGGATFCAGADLKERAAMTGEEVAAAVPNIGNAFRKLAGIPVPVIAAIQGGAFGGGFELALAADLRVAVASAQLALREAALAIIPGAGGTQRLTRLAGPGKAMLWITTARLFSAQEALAHGAIDFVAADEEELMQTAKKLATDIAQCGPLAVQQAKRAIYGGLDKSLEEGLAWESECYRKTIPTQDRIEGLTAFKEKRKPKYTGK